MQDLDEADRFLAELGMEDVPRFYVTRQPPTPAMERRDDVIAGVRSLSEALEKIREAPIPAAYRAAKMAPKSASSSRDRRK